MIITINHIRAYGYCARGTRAFFNSHQLDWQSFLTNGVEAEKLLATNDALAIELVKHVQKEVAANGHGQ